MPRHKLEVTKLVVLAVRVLFISKSLTPNENSLICFLSVADIGRPLFPMALLDVAYRLAARGAADCGRI